MNLEDLQKEREKALREEFPARVWNLPYALLTTFINDSIRLAYEAGAIANEESHLIGKISRKKGFQAGLERAKELVPKELPEDVRTPRGKISAYSFVNVEINKNNHSILSAIDAVITKNNER